MSKEKNRVRVFILSFLVGILSVASGANAAEFHEIRSEPTALKQGEIIEFKLSAEGMAGVEGQMDRVVLRFYPKGPSVFAALIGSDLEAKPRVAKLSLTTYFMSGSVRHVQIPLTIKQKAFPQESFSVPAEFDRFGVSPRTPRERVARLGETLDVVRALWSGEPVDYAGEYHTVSAAVQQPPPLSHIPIIIGGSGERTLRAVAKHADWWNLPIYSLDRLEELRPSVGNARVSTHEMIGFVASESERGAVTEVASRRFGSTGMGKSLTIGSAEQLRTHFAERRQRGVERFYVWFLDFAQPATLAAFGRDVIAHTDLSG